MDIIPEMPVSSGSEAINFTDKLCGKACEFFLQRADGFRIAGGLTDYVDSVMQTLYSEVTAKIGHSEYALIAVGGYGRREMMPFSDIDILLLARENSEEIRESVQTLLYCMWDKGLNISHSVRTLNECVEDCLKDLQTRTALMDCRFLSGSKAVFDEFMRDCYPRIVLKDKRGFISSLLTEVDRRHKTTGESLYLLEPNIKECRGGLRDIHTISWLSRAELRISSSSDYVRFLSERQFRDFVSAHNFLLKLRAAVHICSRRKNDTLSANIHNSVALALGFRNTKRYFASEIMMRAFYMKSRAVSDSLAKISRLCGRKYINVPALFTVRKITKDFSLSKNEIIVRDPEILRDTGKMMEAFRIFSETGRMFSLQVEEILKNNAFLIGREGRVSREAITHFRDTLRGNRVYETLGKMHETSVLDRFIPEFGRIRHLVIIEAFHRYTVDAHTLIAIRNMENLKKCRDGKLGHLAAIFEKINQETLYAAMLFHDIGKGISRKHEEAGYLIIRNILERLLYDQNERQVIEFLVRNHITLAKFALTRDIDSPETVIRMAEIAQNETNLDMLYIMTYADMSAVNPFFWSEWKASLLGDLYGKTLEHLRGIIRNPYSQLDHETAAFAGRMSGRYLLSNTAEEIRRDCDLSKLSITEDIVSLVDEKGGAAELIILSSRIQGLFPMAAGVLSRRRLNIVRARLFIGAGDLIVCKLIISNWKEQLWEGLEACIKDDLRKAALRGVPDESSRTFSNPGGRHAGRPGLLLEIDNETGEKQTILDVIIPDHVGLLYDIAIRLQTFKIDILSAMINTEDGMAHDVFYLQKRADRLSAEDCERILGALLAIEPG
jgi:[protein-PII] uridylyltransferase